LLLKDKTLAEYAAKLKTEVSKLQKPYNKDFSFEVDRRGYYFK
jgi:hypothetical protein